MVRQHKTLFLASVKDFIAKLSITNQAKVAAAINMMVNGEFGSVYTKKLKGPVHELIVKSYRFVYYIKGNEIYFVNAFVKKSAKTPKRVIEHAEKLFKNF
ncbi:type II toxin-antitoxin system RelE/ParE family toxin [Candidatus Kaiserbacteria bacterium]|nr:type II toxin-antitoxin system RelE/ParE family toxin [Candidatus Kaiserbacteria bacterium]